MKLASTNKTNKEVNAYRFQTKLRKRQLFFKLSDKRYLEQLETLLFWQVKVPPPQKKIYIFYILIEPALRRFP